MPSSLQVVRVLRLSRMLKLFKNLKQMQLIVNTFITILPVLMNITLLMFLFIFIYAILGMNLFAVIKVNGAMTSSYLNFQSVYNAMITLIRIITGESWNYLLVSISSTYSITFQCIENPTYDDYVANGYEPVGCGSPFATKLYFYSFLLIVGTILINLFIAVILDGYSKAEEKEKQVFNSYEMERFQTVWADFDPSATGHI